MTRQEIEMARKDLLGQINDRFGWNEDSLSGRLRKLAAITGTSAANIGQAVSGRSNLGLPIVQKAILEAERLGITGIDFSLLLHESLRGANQTSPAPAEETRRAAKSGSGRSSGGKKAWETRRQRAEERAEKLKTRSSASESPAPTALPAVASAPAPATPITKASLTLPIVRESSEQVSLSFPGHLLRLESAELEEGVISLKIRIRTLQ